MLLEDFKGNVLLSYLKPLETPHVTSFDLMDNHNVDGSYPKKIAQLVEKYSGSWLHEIGGKQEMFYRGIGSMTKEQASKDAVVSQRVNMSRNEPSDERLHQFLIKNINDCSNGKAVANRHNSAFVTSNRLQARGYGIIYVALPMGEYHYTWHKKYRDMVAVEKETDNDFDREEFCKGLVIDQDIKEAHASQHEVMVHANSILLIHEPAYDLYRDYG